MSLTSDLIINPIVLAVAGVFGIFIGYLIGRRRLAKAHSKIQRLEADILSSNQETLEAQKAFVELEAKLKQGQPIPVIPMKINGNGKESPKEKATK
ncbi:MAG TPA: hypothetical protein VG605_01745 [Puia sp.]|nr:hypothetical protein [Puia sp.]